MTGHVPGPFTHYCPNGKSDEQYAHDVSDSMSTDSLSDRFLYCRKCGQAVPVREAMEATHLAVHPRVPTSRPAPLQPSLPPIGGADEGQPRQPETAVLPASPAA